MISSQPIRIVDLKADPSRLRVKGLRITELGHIRGRTSVRRDAVFQSWAFGYIAGGQGWYQVDDGEAQLVTAGSLFLVYPGSVFHYGPEDGGRWDEYYVRFEGDRVEEWLSHWLPDPGQVKVSEPDEAMIAKLEAMMVLMDSGVPAHIDRAALLLESALYEWIANQDATSTAQMSPHIAKVLLELESALFQPMDNDLIAALARRHHISVSTLRRIVSQYTGFPLNGYLHRLKVAEAKRLLLNTDMPIKEIAQTLGYTDVFYFSRVFKKHAAVAPHHYRLNV